MRELSNYEFFINSDLRITLFEHNTDLSSKRVSKNPPQTLWSKLLFAIRCLVRRKKIRWDREFVWVQWVKAVGESSRVIRLFPFRALGSLRRDDRKRERDDTTEKDRKRNYDGGGRDVRHLFHSRNTFTDHVAALRNCHCANRVVS